MTLPADPIVAALAGVSCSSVSDALDRLGLPGSALGLAPLQDGMRMAGRAFTVRYAPAGSPPGTVGDYIDDVEPGGVVALDNGGRVDCTVWGDILTAVAAHRGLSGTAINGVCRDVHRALDTGYPVFSRGRFLRTGKDRVEAVEIGGTVSLGDAQARAGDVVLGDADGVVVVPAHRAAEVAELAAEIEKAEGEILTMALERGSLRTAREALGYHTLQRGSTSRGDPGRLAAP